MDLKLRSHDACDRARDTGSLGPWTVDICATDKDGVCKWFATEYKLP